MPTTAAVQIQSFTRVQGDLYRVEVQVGLKTLRGTLLLDGSVPPPDQWRFGDLGRIAKLEAVPADTDEKTVWKQLAWQLDSAVRVHRAPDAGWVTLHRGRDSSATVEVRAAGPVFVKVCANAGTGDDDGEFVSSALLVRDARPVLGELLAQALAGVAQPADLDQLQSQLERAGCGVERQ